VATRGKTQKIQRVDTHEVNAWNVSECFDKAVVIFVHNQRTPSALIPSAAHLSLTRPRLLSLALCQFFTEAKVFKAFNSRLGFRDAFNVIGDNEWDLLCGVCDAVSAGFNKWRTRGRC